MKTLFALTVLLSLFLFNACASIAHSKYQEVPVISQPAGADVVADCGKGATSAGQTPVVVKLDRKADRCVITMKKDGYEESSTIVKRRLSGWFWCNLFLPYVTVPGALVDLYDGAAYKRTPGAITTTLNPERDAAAATSR